MNAAEPVLLLGAVLSGVLLGPTWYIAMGFVPWRSADAH